MKIVKNQSYEQLSGFLKSIHDQFEKTGTVIYKQRNEIRVFEINSLLVNVKRFKTPHLFNRIMYTFFRSSKAQRSFFYALKFKDMSIETAEPVAYIHTKRHGLLHYSYYISLQADYNRSMDVFGKGSVHGREHILKAFAKFTAKLHAKGVIHKDYAPRNILFKEENGDIKFCIVDINRIKFGFVSISQGCKNFARLWGQKSFFDIIVRQYAAERNADPEQCLIVAMQARRKYWKRYTRKYPWPFEPDDEIF